MKTIFNPFERYSEKVLLAVGIVAMILGSFLAYTFNVRFDGVLDMHTGQTVSVLQPFIDNLINLICLLLFLFGAAWYVNRKARIVDIFSSILVARIPFLLMPFLNINDFTTHAGNDIMRNLKAETLENISDFSWVALTAISIVSLVLIIWSMALLYNGFKVASNAKGKQPVFFFVLAIISAEILSKIIFSLIN